MEQLLFASLPSPQSRWKSFLTGWGIQATFVATLLAFNALFPQAIPRAKKYVVTNLVAYEPPVVMEAQPVNPRLTVRIKPVKLPVIETPTVAKIVLPAPVRKRVEPEPDVKPPEIKLDSSKLPLLPNAPAAKVAATNTFATPTKEVPTTTKPAAQVQTGGFGDPNGVPAHEGKGAVNIAAKGSFGLPTGVGFGNGLGGAKGTPGVGIVGNGTVQSSGFDNHVAGPVRKVGVAASNSPTNPVEIVSKPKPLYTDEGRKLKIEGEVRLEVQFTTTGEVHVVKVLKGLGYGLDEQAVRAAEQIKFKPALHEGQPVDSTAVVHIIFELA
jgi:TonB family protein